MTPNSWYQEKRKQYFERFGVQWEHKSMFSEYQDTEVCETAMRCGIESRFLKPSSAEEIEMIANAVMIRDYLKARKNSPKSIQRAMA
jgi:DNA-binding NarL/FixJ family response regulator